MTNTSNNYAKNRKLLRAALAEECACPYCNAIMLKSATHDQPHSVTIDHIQPRSKGGSNQLTNLVAVCKACNARKSDKEKILFFKLETPKLLTKTEYSNLGSFLEMSNRLNTLKEIRNLVAEDDISGAISRLETSKEVGTKVRIFDNLISFIQNIVGKVNSIMLQLKTILSRLNTLISELEGYHAPIAKRVAHLSFTTYAL